MNGADVRKANDTDNEKAKRHRQHGLNDHARIGSDSGQVGGLGLLHVDPHRRYQCLAENEGWRDPKFSVAWPHPGW
jgi:hypothetical protein